MHTVVVYNISAIDAVNLKNELVNYHGLIDGQDFFWSWFPTVLDEYSYFTKAPSKMEMRFYNESQALFFNLKYSNAPTQTD